MTSLFKSKHTFEKRCAESKRILDKYESRVPIIVESSSPKLVLDKAKYLVPDDLSVSQFLYVIRKRVKLHEQSAMFMFFGGISASGVTSMKEIYEKYKDEDGFLYSTISLENAFG